MPSKRFTLQPSIEPDAQDVAPTTPIPPTILALVAAATASAAALFITRPRSQTVTPGPSNPTKPRPTLPEISALVRLWLEQDPDIKSRNIVQSWLHKASTTSISTAHLLEIAARLDPTSRLTFGTSGLRAPVRPGHDSLNVLTVLRAAQGVLRHAQQACSPDSLRKGVVIGHDARYDSRRFAVAMAAVFNSQDIPVMLFSRPVPTPFVPYTLVRSRLALGICVTASHNPPQDNGVKVYWEDGILTRPKRSADIEHAIRQNLRPWMSYDLTEQSLSVHDPIEEISTAYYDQIVQTLRQQSPAANLATPPVVYTACHGVGYEYIRAMFKKWSLPEPIPVLEQVQPDPAFPTLPFPNPEEPGALDLAIATARAKGARLVLANDPDADRLGVAEVGDSTRIFTGDEIAALLTDYLTRDYKKRDMSAYAVVASTVSSKILASMARNRAFEFRESLTGFKWLNKRAVDLQAEGKIVLLTYEEAIGYNVTRNIVRDKDGVSAAAVFAELAGVLYASGITLAQRMEQLLEECGVHLSRNGYLRTSPESNSTAEIFDEARKNGLPKKFGNAVVKSVRDLTMGLDTAEVDGQAVLPADPNSQFLTFRCGYGSEADDDSPLIIHLRGSGTGKLHEILVS